MKAPIIIFRLAFFLGLAAIVHAADSGSNPDHNLKWSEASDGVQVAIEVRHVNNPQDWKAISTVPIDVHLRVVGDRTLNWLINGNLENVTYITKDARGNSNELHIDRMYDEISVAGLKIQPQQELTETAYFPLASVKDVKENLSVRMSVFYDPKQRFDVVSLPMDAKEITDFVRSLDGNPVATNAANSATASITPDSSLGAVPILPTPKPATKPKPPIAQAESPSYTMPAIIALGFLIVAGYFFRRRR